MIPTSFSKHLPLVITSSIDIRIRRHSLAAVSLTQPCIGPGEYPTFWGPSISPVGGLRYCRWRPAPPRVGGTGHQRVHLFLNGADILAQGEPSGLDPNGVVDAPVHDRIGVGVEPPEPVLLRIPRAEHRRRRTVATFPGREPPAEMLPRGALATTSRRSSARWRPQCSCRPSHRPAA